ncbi:outer membrane protein P2 family protein [Haemophilus parainfluenzae ATCC 33392]|uniref:Outer membrane protein P2 n=1 Tax=Haemophilus parainfluenzae ATCC 33392 TaxID=888828 RepID=A0ABD7ZGT3_HAEPA|nr:porin [Haemophilus parainfluenzae]EGC71561.1 Gram-negative porin [Haemophilus parainfluenzae ATCC 33392]KFL98898.1 outer membrane protein P2 family protein [Haemophilus parainfluenzae ATCC 33392]QQB22534.1 porin [Haemophilus parainfluenzae]WMS24185.1 porin [Haemophilus parainfluenzae ATCC 33392]STO95107.1 Outer membrane porin protein BP0840 precursor [Haemophilus parainfluenzae ATCC 33392]
MKKTLAALIVSAVAASAANAAVVYDNEGTKVDFNGSLRLVLEKANNEGYNNSHTHSGLRNAGSRVAVKVTHDLGDDFYALGRFELRFDGKKSSQDGFGDVYVKRAYAGLGNKQYGELTFGRQLLIADDLSTAEDYEYGILNKGDYIPTAANSAIRYDYRGVKDLQLGASYQFADSRNLGKAGDNEVKVGAISNGYQVGAIYNGKWDDVNGIIAKFGYGRTTYKTDLSSTAATKKHQDGLLASLGYVFNDFIVSVDGGYARERHNQGVNDVKRYFVSPGFIVPVIADKSKVYGNYKYEQEKQGSEKSKTHGFLLGVDYKLHKQVVLFLEGKYVVTKDYNNGTYVADSKQKDKAIGVGMRVYF